ncbi:MAG: bifunctional folylpolyglutamate synthase/dihydrofolate synthase [Hyphomicrobiales bacterium]|nr:bifunctional folylpolyglutamate synthase/dihydrofolate synthase [Hyphomicrobiales bacterium]
MKTDALIEHLSQFHPKGYDLSLGRISELLSKLGGPQDKLPPTFHVAGTNGKGSVIANLRAILEASGYSVHAHTSPHLVNYHERYRIGHGHDGGVKKGQIVGDNMLADALGRVADANDGAQITMFELLAATMFVLFSEQRADYAIVEVGLGGRFDGTNVIKKPKVSIITPISLDHQTHLGDTIAAIAFEKAGIIKPGCPVIIGEQEDEAREVLENIVVEKHCPVMIARQDFDYYEEAGRFIYQDVDGLLDLPLPGLRGEHQLANSATAIAALRLADCQIKEETWEQAMGELYWPGRFEQLPSGTITRLLSDSSDVWIDGGHNVGAGEVISKELEKMNSLNSKDLVMICAMLTTKNPQQYFAQFVSLKPKIYTVPITTSQHGIGTQELAEYARAAGLEAIACHSLDKALAKVAEIKGEYRLLIAGSLYLVGEVLKKNGTTLR